MSAVNAESGGKTVSVAERAGKFRLRDHGPFRIGPKAWQRTYGLDMRIAYIDTIAGTFVDTTGPPDPRLEELQWFIRCVEEDAYNKYYSRVLYEKALLDFDNQFKDQIADNPVYMSYVDKAEIPPTEDLELLFGVKCPRWPTAKEEEEDLKSYRAPAFKIIDMVPFSMQRIEFDIEPVQANRVFTPEESPSDKKYAARKDRKIAVPRYTKERKEDEVVMREPMITTVYTNMYMPQ